MESAFQDVLELKLYSNDSKFARLIFLQPKTRANHTLVPTIPILMDFMLVIRAQEPPIEPSKTIQNSTLVPTISTLMDFMVGYQSSGASYRA
ncbi:hypothetical protein KSP40_PGU003080 [Platanthera guangdongensis]|uniref:Uncharacterized protein n=1 Tax=Platanthera guangdongensis TaxID=2320717 RepID=A0ABR2LUL9_9ASPA